jgi:hypothetical protein
VKTWFTSLNGAIALSVLALLAFLARVMGLDAMFVLPGEMGVSQAQPGTVALIMLLVVVFFGGWIWALLAAVRGGWTGLIVTLILSLLSGLGGAYTLLALCGDKGCAAWPVGNIVVWAELLFGLAAAAALGLHLQQARRS